MTGEDEAPTVVSPLAGAGADPRTEPTVVNGSAGRDATGAGAPILDFVSLFRLASGWDKSRSRAFRRLIGVKLESLVGIGLAAACQRLRSEGGDRRGIPFAVLSVALGLSNIRRGLSWLRGGRSGR